MTLIKSKIQQTVGSEHYGSVCPAVKDLGIVTTVRKVSIVGQTQYNTSVALTIDRLKV